MLWHAFTTSKALNVTDTETDVSWENSQTAVTELVAVLVAVTDGQARVLTTHHGQALPSGPLSPVHRSLQNGVRVWVEEQTAQPLGYVEQLYTFADTGRSAKQLWLMVSYLGLVNEVESTNLNLQAKWQDWYVYFPWEDRRSEHTERNRVIMAALDGWISCADDTDSQQFRQQRVDMYWGRSEWSWSEELVLQRYEMLYEVGLLPESAQCIEACVPYTGQRMQGDHRRILATALSRLRAKIKYRPLIFDLMPPIFTLLQLQQAIEALAGLTLHKPNFRRLIQHQDLIEPTGQSVMQERGRPAQLYRFKPNVLKEQSLARGRMPVHK